MSNKSKPKQFYEGQARKLLEHFSMRTPLPVRDVARTLDYSSTAAALNAINNMIKHGYIIQEYHGETRKFFLNTDALS
jgi:hypothetical protein